MHIKSLRLEDFQSYKDSTVEFDKGFNCIVGRNSSGKSAIIRALSFILFGHWDTNWVREGASLCRITLTTNSGTEVIREKGKSVNKYIVKVGDKEDVYENFGKEVPDQVQDILQIRRAQIDKKEYLNLNLSSQHDKLFLITETGSFRAKVIGHLSDVHLLDYSLREINKDKRGLSSEKKIKEKERDSLVEQLKKYDGVEDVKTQLDELKLDIEKIQSQKEHIEKLRVLAERASKWKERYNAVTNISDTLNELNGTEKHVEDLTTLAELNTKLSELERKLIKQQDYIDFVDKEEKEAVNSYLQLLEKEETCPSCFGDITKEQIGKIKDNL